MWNIWIKHAKLGLLNIGRHYAKNSLAPEKVLELWKASQNRIGYSTPEGAFARQYMHTALDNYGN